MAFELPAQPHMQMCTDWPQDSGGGWQHHRCEEFYLGRTALKVARTAPTTHMWYADFLPGREFATYQQLLAAFFAMPTPRYNAVQEVLKHWPQATALEPLPTPQAGAARPVCSLDGTWATHLLQVQLSWHPAQARMVYLSKKAMKAYKEQGLTYICASLPRPKLAP